MVELNAPNMYGGAVALKTEKIVFCPIQKVSCRRLSRFLGVGPVLTALRWQAMRRYPFRAYAQLVSAQCRAFLRVDGATRQVF